MPTITGTSGNDTITDTTGNDTIFALEGDDVIQARGPLDHVEGGAGVDTLILVLNRNKFNVPFMPDQLSANLTDGGSDGAFYIRGGDELHGNENRIEFTSIDRFILYWTSDSSYDISTGDGDDIIYTGSGYEGVFAHGGNDLMIAAGQPDRFYGGPGDDVYYVNYFMNQAYDGVNEAPGEGFDIVYAKNSFSLPANSEVEWIQELDRDSTGAYFLGGSTTSQTILANNGNNSIDGRGGGDGLYGYLGDDIYYVASLGDVVVEADGEGFDTVYSTTDYALPAFTSVESLQSRNSQGSAGLNLTGNAFSQTIAGDKGDNHLDGNGGGDVLNGYLGNDTYVINASNDSILDFAGQGSFDSVYARVSYALGAGVEIEYLSTILHAGTDAIDLTGNALAQTIYGNAGANRLNGNGGSDVLMGFGGNDAFVFTAAPVAGNHAMLSDFLSCADRIELDDSTFSALSPGALAASAFVSGTAAQDADDRIIFDAATGALYYDSDGTGAAAAVQFATLQSGAALTSADIFVI